MTDETGTKCEACGTPVNQVAKGRPRRFCSTACRKAAWRARKRPAKTATVAVLPPPAPVTGDVFPAKPAALPFLADPAPPAPARFTPPATKADPETDPAGAIAEWAERCLKVPTGPLRDRSFRLDPWQIEWMRRALADDIREAGLSVARKNGKSGLVAVLLLAHLCGPLNAAEWRGLVTSLTGELAKELRHAIEATARISGLLDTRRGERTAEDFDRERPIRVYKSPTPGRIDGANGARLDFLAADKAGGHAVGADLACIDEGGLMPEALRTLWAAIASSVSGRDGRLLVISVRGDGPMFAELAERSDDPTVHWKEFAAADDSRLDDPAAWHAANPGLASGIKSESYMRDMARRALANPADAPFFRSLDLNMPQSPTREMILAPDQWAACVVDDADLPPRAGPCYFGFDLGGSTSQTARAAYWPETGRLEVAAAFPDEPDLDARGAGDGVGGRYRLMEQRGELRTYPGRVTPVGPFLADAAADLEGEDVALALADRYRQAEAVQAFRDCGLEWPVEWRAQGSGRDGSADIRDFQREVLERRVKCRRSLLMEQAIRDSAVRRDANGNPALEKGRQRGRIDALAAAVLAIGAGRRERGDDAGSLIVASRPLASLPAMPM